MSVIALSALAFHYDDPHVAVFDGVSLGIGLGVRSQVDGLAGP